MKHTFSWKYERSVMPSELLTVAFDFDRDVEKLWDLELPVEEIPSAELDWHLDMPFFWQPDQPFSLRPREVLTNPEHYQEWMQTIMDADTSYPIDIIWWQGRWQILDGLHRFCQLVVRGESRMRVRKLPVEWVYKITPD